MANKPNANVLRLLEITKELGYPLQGNAVIIQGAKSGMTDREAREAYNEAVKRDWLHLMDRGGMVTLTEQGLAALKP